MSAVIDAIESVLGAIGDAIESFVSFVWNEIVLRELGDVLGLLVLRMRL